MTRIPSASLCSVAPGVKVAPPKLTGTSSSPAPSLPLGRGIRAERLDADRKCAECVDVADAAVDHEPRPAVLESEAGDVVADERAAQRAAAVDDEHTPVARLADALLHEDVVLEAANRRDLARERRDGRRTGGAAARRRSRSSRARPRGPMSTSRVHAHEVEEPLLEELAHDAQRVVAQLRGLALAELESAHGALDRLVEGPVWPSRVVSSSAVSSSSSSSGHVPSSSDDPCLLHVAAPVELLVEPHLVGERQPRARGSRPRPPRRSARGPRRRVRSGRSRTRAPPRPPDRREPRGGRRRACASGRRLR